MIKIAKKINTEKIKNGPKSKNEAVNTVGLAWTDQDRTVFFFTTQFAWRTENIHFVIKAASKPILKWAEKSKSETMTHSDLVFGKFKFHQHTLSPSNSKIISISNFIKDADMTVSTSFPVQSKATTNVKADSVAQNLDQEWDYIRLRHSHNHIGHKLSWVTMSDR